VCNISAGGVGLKNASYSYDANGNITIGDGRTVTWSAFDKPLTISQGSNTSTMTYGPERQLLTRADVATGQTTSGVHVGACDKVTLPNGNVEERHSIGSFRFGSGNRFEYLFCNRSV